MTKVLIIGEHPLKDCIREQYVALGTDKIEECGYGTLDLTCLQDVSEVVILTPPTLQDGIAADNVAIEMVGKLAKSMTAAGHRPTVHLLLQCQESLRLLNTREYNDDWHKVLELNAFTMEDVWAKNILCMNRTGVRVQGLDYKTITVESDHTVHLVVFGTSSLATALVENAALVAHYPNYTRDHKLRTRITLIDSDIETWSQSFISGHKPLMDNSYYRHIDIKTRQCNLHKPMYDGQKEDFVDVEWEFVTGTLHDVVVQDKLLGWASDEAQVLSVAVCHEKDSENLSQVNLLADLLCEYEVPLYVKQEHSAFNDILSQSPRMKHVTLFGMKDHGYDITLPLLKKAKRVKSVYDYCYQYNIEGVEDDRLTAPSYIDDAEVERQWLQEKKAVKRYSNICNAMTLTTKMRSLGHTSDNMNTFYAITREEIELIAKVEHNRWNVEEMLLGFRPCTNEEQAEIEADITRKSSYKKRLVHYDLRAYDDLRADDTGKCANTYDLCLSASIPLIAYERDKNV